MITKPATQSPQVLSYIDAREIQIDLHPDLLIGDNDQLNRFAELTAMHPDLLSNMAPVILLKQHGKHIMIARYITYYVYLHANKTQAFPARVITDKSEARKIMRWEAEEHRVICSLNNIILPLPLPDDNKSTTSTNSRGKTTRINHIMAGRLCPFCLENGKSTALQASSGKPNMINSKSGLIQCFKLVNKRNCDFSIIVPAFHYKLIYEHKLHIRNWIMPIQDDTCPICGSHLYEMTEYFSDDISHIFRRCRNYFSKNRNCSYSKDIR